MSVPVCRFYNLNQTCRFGKHCRYLHPVTQRPPPSSTLRDENEEHLKNPEDSFATLTISDKHERLSVQENEGSLSSESVKQPSQNQGLAHSTKDEDAVPFIKETPSRRIRKPVCYYFNTFGRCRYGNDCKFYHDLSSTHNGFRYNEGQRRRSRNTEEIPPRFRKTEDQKDQPAAASAEFVDDRNISTRHIRTEVNSAKQNDVPNNGSRRNGSTERRLCPFFKSGRCNRGDHCQFMHNIDSEDKTDALTLDQPHSKIENNQTNSSYNTKTEKDDVQSERSQSGQAGRPASYSAARPIGLKQMFTYAELEDIGAMKVRDSEINTIKRRFPRDKLTVLEETESKFSVKILFLPTDPDWPFDVQVFELLVMVPSDYPKEMLSVKLPTEQDLPETVRRYVELSIKEWLDHKAQQLAAAGKVELVFRPFLRWLDRSIEDITTEALKQLKRELVARAAGMEFITAEKLQAKFKAQEKSADEEEEEEEEREYSDSTSAEETGDGSEDDSDEDSSDEEDDETTASPLNLDPEKKGTEIELRHMQLREKASALMFEKLKLVLQCGRCKHHSDILVSHNRVMSIRCEKCNQNQFVHFRAALIHQFSSVAGYLDLDGCQAFDLIFQDCRVAVTCMNCSKQTRMDGLASGQMVDGWCQACNARFKLATEAVKFSQLVPSTVNTTASRVVEVASVKQKKPPKDPAIREGCPLPEFGTCKHYKHSYRWLRFPCCGKAYPCDICHEKQEEHEMARATRMICGHCCREQNFSVDRPCSACGQHLTKIRTAHWEGGSGCRDRIAMSKRDQQKYKNMNKTLSNHKKKVQAGSMKKKTTKLRHV